MGEQKSGDTLIGRVTCEVPFIRNPRGCEKHFMKFREFNIRSTCSIPASSTKVSADRAWHNNSVKEFAAMGLKFPRHSWLFSLCLHCYALLCCTQMWESAACLWVDCIANKSERWPVMLTLGNADAPAGKISREGNHRHVTHTLIDCSTIFHGQEQDQNKEEKLPLPCHSV